MSKSSYPSADTTQIELELQFLVGTTTRVEIQFQKVYSVVYTKTQRSCKKNFVVRKEDDRQLCSTQNVAGCILQSLSFEFIY